MKSVSLALAREIMGKNIFEMEDAFRVYYPTPSSFPALKQMSKIIECANNMPFSEKMLMACKDTHILTFVLTPSILDVRKIVEKQSDQKLFYSSQDWYDRQDFCKKKGKVGWQLVRKEPIFGSILNAWEDQQTFLLKDEEVPTAQIMVYTTIGYFFKTGERLFEKTKVRCADLDRYGFHVEVGLFDTHGLGFNHLSVGGREDILGLASAKKPK